MATIEKRIKDLESRMGENNHGTVQVIFIAPLTKDAPPEITEIYNDNQRWQREPGESEEAFKERARREASPNPKGIQVLFCN